MSQEIVAQAPADAHDLAVMLEDFDIAEHGKLVHRVEQARAYGLHLRPADANELQSGPVSEHCAHEMGAKLIPRSFACDDADDQRALCPLRHIRYLAP